MRENLVLGREEVYQASSRVWSFKQVDDIVNGMELRLTNMAGGFPFEFGGTVWADSERLYLCGEFSDNTEEHLNVQKELCRAKSGYGAKRFIKAKHRKQVRSDFEKFRLQWMLFCVWAKCMGNANFRKLLLSIPDDVILVENTTTDTGGTAEIWGCRNKDLTAARKALAEKLEVENPHLSKKELKHLINVETNKLNNIGEWKGQNNIGKILMICRDCLKEGIAPVIDYDRLSLRYIFLFGKRLRFTIPSKYEKVIDDYAAKGEHLQPLVALRHLTELYMEQCGISLTLRTLVYEAGEFWLHRLMQSSAEWKEKLGERGEYLFWSMQFFHEEYTLEEYEEYDITGLTDNEWRSACDYLIEELAQDIDRESNTIVPYNEEALQAFCWGAKKRLEQNDTWEYVDIRV